MKVLKILVPLDGSVAAEAALPEVVERIKDNAGARLILVHAVDPASVPGGAGSDDQARAIGDAAEYVQKVAVRLRSEGVRRIEGTVWFASPRLAIAESIRTVKPDVVVMPDRCVDRDGGPGSTAPDAEASWTGGASRPSRADPHQRRGTDRSSATGRPGVRAGETGQRAIERERRRCAAR